MEKSAGPGAGAGSTRRQEELREVAVADCIPTKENPRVIDEKSPGFQELLESVRGSGILVPPHARAHPKKKGKYDLRCGERRLRAAKLAGLETITVIMHLKMDDKEAFDLTFTENFGREDLTPLEQSKAVGTLLKKHKGDASAVASLMGQSERWVRMREAIDGRLSQKWKDKVGKTGMEHWTSAHLEQIARLPADMQAKLFHEFFNTWKYQGGHPHFSVKDLKKEVADESMYLRKASWNVEDEDLVAKVGACSRCDKRSGAQPELFEESLDEATLKKHDRCFDAACWYAKAMAHVKALVEKHRQEHPDLQPIVTEYPDHSARQNIKESLGSYHDDDEWTPSTKDAKGALPAVVVHGKGMGSLRWIKIKEQRDTGGAKVRAKGVPSPLKEERRENFKKKRWMEVLRRLIEKMQQAPYTDLRFQDKMRALVVLAGQFGTARKQESADSHTGKDGYYASGPGKYWENVWSAVQTRAGKADNTHVLGTLWLQVKGVLTARLKYIGPIRNLPDAYVKEAKEICKLLGLDVNAMFKEVCESKGFTEPKAWAKLNPDGTPKMGEEKKPEKKKKAVPAGKGKKKPRSPAAREKKPKAQKKGKKAAKRRSTAKKKAK